MIVRKIRLKNWLRFKGEHTLYLEAKAYAVVARLDTDKDRSNFLGKTALIEAVRFALYGEHRFRTEDEWITKGESEGGVELVFDDDFAVGRERTRGKATKLWAGLTTGGIRARADGGGATGDEAQVLIHRCLGLTLRDFDASAYLDQRSIAKMVLADPGDRMKIVEAWLELGPAKAAEEFNAVKLRLASEEVDGVAQRMVQLAARRAETRSEADTLEWIKTAEEVAIEERRRLGIVNAKLKGFEVWDAAQARKREYEQLVDEGKQLRAHVKPEDLVIAPALGELERELDAKRDAYSAAVREEDIKRRLTMAEFDGNCPVGGIPCPAKDQINGQSVKNATMHVEAQRTAQRLGREWESLKEKVWAMRNVLHALTERNARIAEITRKVHVLADQLDVDPPPNDNPEELRRQQLEHTMNVRAQVTALETFHKEIEKDRDYSRQDESLRFTLALAEKNLASLREAALVLGPRGMQRMVAEPFLKAIEQGANEALLECLIDLKVGVRWEHEGKDIAKACSACGHPFPASARVKQCTKCGADRGKNIVNRLDFEFSNRSAGAEDMWGVAMQLAATAWLREGRGAALETAFFDEPWAHLDKSHRKALTRAFVSMLGRFGIRQAFLVAHSLPEQTSFPGRIEIVGRTDGTSTVSVVS